MKKSFYASTPIYYPTDNLHIGHALTTVLADVFVRYKKMQGYKTFFVTGTDEHGQKISQYAKKSNLDNQTFVDHMAKQIKKLWLELDINYDYFSRTTSKAHQTSVQKITEKLLAKQLIYKGNYQGVYCINCEEFLTTKQIAKKTGTCLLCQGKPQTITEETYFFKVKAFRFFLKKLIDDNPVYPIVSSSKIRHELKNNFLEPGLKDLSIARKTFRWGVPFVGDEAFVVYVWFDALINYISALGYQNSNPNLMEEFWTKNTEIVQFFGKEISRFHCMYWPCLLEGLNLTLPTKLIPHGWITFHKHKMSKTLKNVVRPEAIIKKFGSDALRFYLIVAIKLGSDYSYSAADFQKIYNHNLANNFGNLISRVSNMLLKFQAGQMHHKINLKHNPSFLQQQIKVTLEAYENSFKAYDAQNAILATMQLASLANKEIEVQKPWELNKQDQEALGTLLWDLCHVILVVNALLSPVLVKTNLQVNHLFNFPALDFLALKDAKQINAILNKIEVQKSAIFFPRNKEEF